MELALCDCVRTSSGLTILMMLLCFGVCGLPLLQSDPPNSDMIPDEDKVGVTVVLVTCSYRGREFVRVGYVCRSTITLQ